MIQHILRRTLRSLKENVSLNLVATGVIGATVLLAGVYLSALQTLDRVVESWDRDAHVSAYFQPEIDVELRFATKDQIAARAEVASVTYVSEEDAALYLSERVEEVGPILDELGPEVLPASLEITLDQGHATPAEIQAFVDSVSGPPFEHVDYGQEWVQRFHTFLTLLRGLGLVLGLLIFLAAVFLVGNTMHLVAYARRAELETMKLVGATWGFAALPFALEGCVQGFVGGGLGLIGVYALHRVLVARLEDALALALAGAELSFLGAGWGVLLLGASVLLGVLGCLWSVTRFWRQAP